jgi:uncharacterized protein
MKLLLKLLLMFCLCAGAQAEVAVPPLKARTTDLTGTLSADQRAALEKGLQIVEARHGSQIVVLMVPTTQPETIEQYSIRVAEAWKRGDNDLLLLVAKDVRKVRIEVGHGLEGVIPNEVAHRVIDETIAPLVNDGEYMRGLVSGILRIEALLAETSQPAVAAATMPDGVEIPHGGIQTGISPVGNLPASQNIPLSERIISTLADLPTWLIMALIVMGTALRWFIGPILGGLTMGAVVGGGAWFVFESIDVGIVAGVAALIFVLVGIMNWIAIGLSSSSGGSSSSSGGGGFGGGGASGSW